MGSEHLVSGHPGERGAPISLAGPSVRLVTVREKDAAALRAIRATESVTRWWDPVEPGFPMADEPEATRLAIHHDGEIAGMVQFGEEAEPKYRSASIDIFVAPSHQRRGVASEAIALVVEHLTTVLGHHRITIDPAAENTAAIGCYAKLGFRPVGVLRLSERDADGQGWHDQLLMELVVAPGPP